MNVSRGIAYLAAPALAALALCGPLQAQPRFAKAPGGAAAEQGAGVQDGIRPSGLRPAYPSRAQCAEIASPYGSQTRHDGSARPVWAFGGYHGGIDISLDEGTPLLALAGGTVVGTGEGGMLEGIYLWLRHAPEDTGLPYWVYSKYQHLAEPPQLAVGARVNVGQPVARAGRTGTVGRHYGPSGYPHLHLTTRKSASGELSAEAWKSTAPLFDPLAIYHETAGNLSAQPRDGVAIPYATPDGTMTPPGTRVAWPVACAPR